MIIPSNTTALDYLLNKLSVENGREFTRSNVSVGGIVPSSAVTDPVTNSLITLVAIQGAGLNGTVDLNYHRIDLSVEFVGISVKLDPRDFDADATNGDVADKLGELYGMPFSHEDIRNPTGKIGSAINVELTIASTSLVFLPDSKLTIALVVDSNDLNEIIRNKVLGLFYSDNHATPTKTIGPLYSYLFKVTAGADISTLNGISLGPVTAPLAAVLATVSGHPWSLDYTVGAASYTLSGATVTYKGEPKETDPNHNLTSPTMITIKLDLAKNTKFVGDINLYWTP